MCFILVSYVSYFFTQFSQFVSVISACVPRLLNFSIRAPPLKTGTSADTANRSVPPSGQVGDAVSAGAAVWTSFPNQRLFIGDNPQTSAAMV